MGNVCQTDERNQHDEDIFSQPTGQFRTNQKEVGADIDGQDDREMKQAAPQQSELQDFVEARQSNYTQRATEHDKMNNIANGAITNELPTFEPLSCPG